MVNWKARERKEKNFQRAFTSARSTVSSGLDSLKTEGTHRIQANRTNNKALKEKYTHLADAARYSNQADSAIWRGHYDRAADLYASASEEFRLGGDTKRAEELADYSEGARHGEAQQRLSRKHQSRVAAATIVFSLFALATLFASNAITGYAIAGANPQSPSQFGVLFFILGLMGAFVLLNYKPKN